MKKLIMRADDVGYTPAYNLGTFDAIDKGVITTADVMFDVPGTQEALEALKERPWISIGWHPHFWGKPILNPSEVPSMVNEEGKFKYRHDQGLKKTSKFDEVYKESKAQMALCYSILGRFPDTTWIKDDGSEFEAARKQICDEYGIVYNFADKPDREGNLVPALDKWQSLNIYMPNQPATVYKTCYAENYSDRMAYNPVKYFTDDEDGLLAHETVLTAWHPGYLDSYIMNESSLHEGRPMDAAAMMDPDLKKWIIANKIELVNHRDAIFGTHEYQNHLAAIDSPLYIGNMK